LSEKNGTDELKLIQNLLVAAPELKPVYDEHIADNHEVLPYLLIGDVERFTRSLLQPILSRATEAERSEELLKRILECFEIALAGRNPAIFDLLGISFLEPIINLPLRERHIYEGYVARLGPRLREELDRMEAVGLSEWLSTTWREARALLSAWWRRGG